MLHDVYLYGAIGEKYGNHHRFDITTAPEAVWALKANFKEFAADFAEGLYQVIIGDGNKRTYLEPDLFRLRVGENKPVHIIPVTAGAGGGGGLKVIVGLALLTPFTLGLSDAFLCSATLTDAFAAAGAAGTIAGVSYGTLAGIGASMLLSGISQMIAQPPKVNSYNNFNSNPTSFVFNGPVNRTAQGSALPIIYGEFTGGSIVVTAGINVEQLM